MDSWLLDNLVCPRTGERLERSGSHLVSAAGSRYPVVDGIPVLLRDDVEQTMALATTSLRAAGEVARGMDHPDPYHVETLGIDEREKAELRARIRAGAEDVDPVVSLLVGATNGIAYRQLIGRLAEYPIPQMRLPPGRGEVLLDVGCGWGRWSVAASRLGYRTVGVDPSLGAVLAARRVSRRLGTEFVGIVGDARHLPLRSASVDAVFSYSVVQHLSRPDAVRAVSEMGRVLSPGGRALVQMPARYGIRCLSHLARRRFADGDGFDVRYWTFPQLRELFRPAFGAVDLSVDCYLGIGLQPSDARMLPLGGRCAVRLSEWLRRLAGIVRPLVHVADSVYVSGRALPPTGKVAQGDAVDLAAS